MRRTFFFNGEDAMRHHYNAVEAAIHFWILKQEQMARAWEAQRQSWAAMPPPAVLKSRSAFTASREALPARS
jgi:hypothetical protein